jgi:hypothetical protein
MAGTDPIWSHRISVDDVPEAGAHIDLVADGKVRAALAEAAGLRDLPRLEASFDIRRRGAAGLRVEGEVSATVGQTCVVTLEPIENEVSESIDLAFSPTVGAAAVPESGETVMTFSEAEPPEPLVGGSVDLGAIAVEFLMLGIDPYPRKPGAVFETPAHAAEEGQGAASPFAASPFAALAALRKKGGGE